MKYYFNTVQHINEENRNLPVSENISGLINMEQKYYLSLSLLPENELHLDVVFFM